MLKNFWYACEFSQAVTQEPKQFKMLDERFVLYRNSQGKPIVLEDKCPHRGAALSLGWLEHDAIRCPYHGWKFETDGRCTDIPANGPDAPIPKRACVRTYPAEESQGYIWFFYGDLPEAKRPPLPHFPDYLFSEMRPVYNDDIENANYERLMEVNVDFAHITSVHRKSFGARVSLDQSIKYKVKETPLSGTGEFHYHSLGDSKTFLNTLLGRRPGFMARLNYYLPNLILAEIWVGGTGRSFLKFCILVAYLPVDDKTCRSKRIFFRNFLKYPWFDPIAQRIDVMGRDEDNQVVGTIADPVIPLRISDEAHIAADALCLSFRKQRQKYTARGGWFVPDAAAATEHSLIQENSVAEPEFISRHS